jgi:type IV fimbrial biogenesis protein FimT
VNTGAVKRVRQVAHPVWMSARTRPATARKAAAAFTLVELLVVITVVGILMGLGVPSYRYVTNSNRVATEVNGLLGDMMLARSEAIKQGINVTVCPSVSPYTACTSLGTTWQTGWIVFSDYNQNGIVDTTDVVLRVQKAFSGSDTLTPDNTSVYFVTFNREGFATGLPSGNTGVNFVVRTTNPANSQWLRCLNVVFVGSLSTLHAGQANTSGGTCPTS